MLLGNRDQISKSVSIFKLPNEEDVYLKGKN